MRCWKTIEYRISKYNIFLLTRMLGVIFFSFWVVCEEKVLPLLLVFFEEFPTYV